ncbi:protein Rf1, mitochondrial-like isoform X1 [Iris pallida]|uniref:Protein Rf1, mitochondrial-like isoform X1 n=1 Tax=Iris pallida TaxID=29817 RepID=A0AAX6FV03_IRIPA|nr:protein Rf1, mitochondrial-like isoform X1 [Iris pallida]
MKKPTASSSSSSYFLSGNNVERLVRERCRSEKHLPMEDALHLFDKLTAAKPKPQVSTYNNLFTSITRKNNPTSTSNFPAIFSLLNMLNRAGTIPQHRHRRLLHRLLRPVQQRRPRLRRLLMHAQTRLDSQHHHPQLSTQRTLCQEEVQRRSPVARQNASVGFCAKRCILHYCHKGSLRERKHGLGNRCTQGNGYQTQCVHLQYSHQCSLQTRKYE